jgi:GDPmannose 4,6-dehydratase
VCFSSEYQTKHNGYQTKVALTGITGQDGSYLELLLEKDIWFMGKTPCFFFNTQRIDHLYQDQHQENVNFKLHYDLTDSTNIIRIIQEVQ